MFKQILYFAIAFAFAATAFAGPVEDFIEANQFYSKGKFDEARRLYESVVESKHYSANLFYNLGNAEYRLGDKGRAILNYERALALDPSHPEAKANLAFLQFQTGAKTEARSWQDRLFLDWNENSYAVAAAITGWAVIFCLAAILLRKRGERELAWTGAIVCAILCGYAILALRHAEQQESMAIVIAKRAEARFAPADNSKLVDTLPTGSQARILQNQGPWVYCALPGGGLGWMNSDALQTVRPRS